jgi:hypothetical protein
MKRVTCVRRDDRMVLSALGALAVAVAPAQVGCHRAEDGLSRDSGASRARVSACLGHGFASAAAFFGPSFVRGAEPQQQRCVAGARDCAEVLRCVGLDGAACDRDHCDGDVAVHCERLKLGGSVTTREDCSTSTAGNTRCGVIDREQRNPWATCVASDGCDKPICSGDVLIDCVGQHQKRVDCAADGRVCVAGEDGASCLFPDLCEHDHCDGDTAVRCVEGHVFERQNCKALFEGATCTSDRIAACSAKKPHPSCARERPRGWCEGETGVGCARGIRFEVDCAGFAHGRCEEASPTARNARCRL